MTTQLVEETIHGVIVRDPYRWLEDRSAAVTEEWIRDQNRLSEDYFRRCLQFEAVRIRVREYLDVEVTDQPMKVGGIYFYRRRAKGEEQASIYVRQEGRERQLVNPSHYGTFASVAIHRISDDGRLLAFDLRHGGTDRRSIHFLEVDSGRILPDVIPVGYARGLAFVSGCQGFYYCHETEHVADHIIRVHRLGVTEEDQVCFRRSRSAKSRLILISDEERLGIVHIRHSNNRDLLDLWLTKRDEPTTWSQILTDQPLPFIPVLKQGRIYALSFERAPNGRLVELDDCGRETRIVVPESAGTIRQIVIAHDLAFLSRIDRTRSSIESWSLSGAGVMSCLTDLEDGTLRLFPGLAHSSDAVFYTRESFADSPRIFEYSISSRSTRCWDERGALSAPDCTIIQRTSYPSADGVSIPLCLISRRRSSCERSSGTIMSSYGGFGIPATPQFSVLVAIMMELGITFALPGIRGGGEGGAAWHDAACGRDRQVAFNDFIAAAEWLRASAVTPVNHLAVFGGSNSGLLVGAVITQRPDLFQAVVCIAPLLDMVRYETLNSRSNWRAEYGSVDNPEEFAALHAYSPYHRVRDAINYPATLFVTGDSDDRCNPAHVRKMAALLQGREVQQSPILVDYTSERGHAPVLPLNTRIDALARRIAFLCQELNIPIDFGGSHETPHV